MFMVSYMMGTVDESYIDECISEWHHSPNFTHLQLHQFLGLTWEEYATFVEKGPSALPHIKAMRQYKDNQEEEYYGGG